VVNKFKKKYGLNTHVIAVGCFSNIFLHGWISSDTTMNKLYSIDLIAEQTKVRLRIMQSNSTIMQTWF
jgi:hypothetical protein